MTQLNDILNVVKTDLKPPLAIGQTISYEDPRIEWIDYEVGDSIKAQWSEYLLTGVDGKGNIYYCAASSFSPLCDGPNFDEHTEVEIDDIEVCVHPEKKREMYDDGDSGVCHECNSSINASMFEPDYDAIASERDLC